MANKKSKWEWRFRVSYKNNEADDEGKPIYTAKTQGGLRTKKEAESAAAELENKYRIGYDISVVDQLFCSHKNDISTFCFQPLKPFEGVQMMITVTLIRRSGIFFIQV